MAATEAPLLPIHPEVRYEPSDISARRVVMAGAAILLGTWVVVSLLYFFYALLARQRAELSAPVPERAAGTVLLPPYPRLEISPSRDLAALRALEDTQLNGYVWVDKQQGTVAIPIERAMELIAQRGIPPQKTPADLKLPIPLAGSRRTGFEGKVEPEPR